MNLSDFRTALSNYLVDHNVTNSPRFDQEFRDYAINYIYKDLLASYEFWFLDARVSVPLVPGQNWITRPDNINSIFAIYYGSEDRDNKISEVSLRQRDLFNIDGAVGRPTSYMVSGNKIFFYPQPDSATNVIIVYSQNVPDLTEGAPNVIDGFDADWQKLIPIGAAAHLLMTNRGADLQNAQYYESKYDAGLEKMKRNFKRKQRDRPSQIADYQTQPYGMDAHGYN